MNPDLHSDLNSDLNPDFFLLALLRLLADKPKDMSRRLSTFGCAQDVFANDTELKAEITDDLKREVDQDIVWLAEPNHHLITQNDADYPECLRETYDPPYLVFACGDRSSLSRTDNRVAIVGSRKASSYGMKRASAIAEELAHQSVVIVSGLALGIDACAHEGALAAGGITLAILGTGCDFIYPKRNWRLAERIQESGLVISEFPLRSEAFPSHFPRRNRIVTGLCKATIVIEAALRSGSPISARLALAEGREVMALPGLVTNMQARGCHALLKDGALLIESAHDVLRELGLTDESSLENSPGIQQLNHDQATLLACFDQGPLSIDMLTLKVNLPVEELTVNLVSLEVLGLIHSDGGYYQRSVLGNR